MGAVYSLARHRKLLWNSLDVDQLPQPYSDLDEARFLYWSLLPILPASTSALVGRGISRRVGKIWESEGSKARCQHSWRSWRERNVAFGLALHSGSSLAWGLHAFGIAR